MVELVQQQLWLTSIAGEFYIPKVLSVYRLKKHFSIAAVPLFPGLRRFPQGRGFKQWTGDDSKALMKVCAWRPSNSTSI